MKAWRPGRFTCNEYGLSLYKERQLGLVVQGGGMRGVYSAGALDAISDFCPPETFDLVMGTSSGALNAAYYVSRMSGPGTRIYVDDLSSKGVVHGRGRMFGGGFTNLLRWWRLVDIDLMISIVKGQINDRGLDIGSFRAYPGDFLIGLSDAQVALPFYVNARDLSDDDLHEALRATAALPAVYNKKVTLGSSAFVDGALIDSLPALRALALGCRRLVVISTRPLSYRSTSEPDYLGRMAVAGAARQSKYVRRWLGLGNPVLDSNMEFLQAREQGRVGQGEVFVISPSDPTKLIKGWADLSAPRVEECAALGYRDAMNVKSAFSDWFGGGSR